MLWVLKNRDMFEDEINNLQNLFSHLFLLISIFFSITEPVPCTVYSRSGVFLGRSQTNSENFNPIPAGGGSI